MDMQEINVTRDHAKDVEEGEEMLAVEVEWVDAIVNIKT
jgi:hypothetical protein